MRTKIKGGLRTSQKQEETHTVQGALQNSKETYLQNSKETYLQDSKESVLMR